MGIEYILNHNCPVKEALTQPGLVRLVKTRSQAYGVLAYAKERGDTRTPEELRITRVRHTVEGDRKQEEVTVRAMLDEASGLDAYARHCAGCPANALAEDFGCYGVITYPIRADTERWLLSLLPNDLATPAGSLLRRAVHDFRYDGGPFLQMRPDTIFFERPQTLARTWNVDGGAWTLTADQLLQMLFGVGHLQPSHCLMASWFLGLVPHGADLTALGGFAGLKRLLAELDVPPAAEQGQPDQCVRFFRALRTAVLLDTVLLIDM